MLKFSEKGAIPVLLLIAGVGLVGFLLVSSAAPFKDKLFGTLYPKSLSKAATVPVLPIGPVVIESPDPAFKGGTVSISWSGVVNPAVTDWIGLYQAGSPDSNHSISGVDSKAWFYTSSCTDVAGQTPRSSGTCTTVIPKLLMPGNYEFRLLMKMGTVTAARSNVFSVIFPPATPTPTPVPSPSTCANQPPTNVTLQGSDGTWCYDSDGNGNTATAGKCVDKCRSIADYCESSSVNRDGYCTGTWNGSSWSQVHCAFGGYTCASGSCSNGACTPTSTPTPTPTPFCKVGVNTFSVNTSCGDNLWRYAYYECYDGVSGTMGGPTSCKSPDVWSSYAQQACQGHSSCATPSPTP